MGKRLPDPKDLLTVTAACGEFDVSRTTVYRWLREGSVTRWKLGGSTRVDRNEVMRHLVRRAA